MSKDWNLNDFQNPTGKGVLELEEAESSSTTLKGETGNTGCISLYIGPVKRKILAKRAKKANLSLSKYIVNKMRQYDII